MMPYQQFDPHITQDRIPYEDQIDIVMNKGEGTVRFLAFNTIVSVRAFGKEDDLCSAFQAVIQACRFFERLFSRTLPNSDISRIGKANGEAVAIDIHTYVLLKNSIYYCEESQGLFDITVGTLSALWDFRSETIPDRDLLQKMAMHVDYRNVRCFEQDGAYLACLCDPETKLDIGGTAKGYIADELGKLLQRFQIMQYAVNLGGNVLVHGRKKDGSRWRVGIRDPFDRDSVLGAVELENASAVTSGIRERAFQKDGNLYHHILNPRTGMPAETDVESVTVVAANSMAAEGYSTTLLSLDEEKRKAFVRRHPEILRCYTVDAQSRIREAF